MFLCTGNNAHLTKVVWLTLHTCYEVLTIHNSDQHRLPTTQVKSWCDNHARTVLPELCPSDEHVCARYNIIRISSILWNMFSIFEKKRCFYTVPNIFVDKLRKRNAKELATISSTRKKVNCLRFVFLLFFSIQSKHFKLLVEKKQILLLLIQIIKRSSFWQQFTCFINLKSYNLKTSSKYLLSTLIQCSFLSKKIFFVAQKEQLFWIRSMSITPLCCVIIWNTPRLVVTYINNLWRNVKLFTNHFLNFNCTKMKWQEFIHNHPSLLESPHSLIYLWHSSADTSVYWSVPLGRLDYRKLHNSDLWYKCREVPATSPILDYLHFVFQRIPVTQVLFNWQIYLTIIIPGPYFIKVKIIVSLKFKINLIFYLIKEFMKHSCLIFFYEIVNKISIKVKRNWNLKNLPRLKDDQFFWNPDFKKILTFMK